MTPTQRAAMEQALEFMEYHSKYWNGTGEHPTAVVTALRAALAEQLAEQEPVAVFDDAARIGWCLWRIKDLEEQLAKRPLYTAPQPAKCVPLTDEDARAICWVGPVYAPDGVVTRTPQQYRQEIEAARMHGIRKAEAAHGIT